MILDFTRATIESIVIHRVGNKLRNEGVITSEDILVTSSTEKVVLINYFLRPFATEEVHKFSHSSDLTLNEGYAFSKELFEGKTNFLKQTIKLLKHLYAVSEHPKIKGGEVFYVLFSGIGFGEKNVEAIGIYKCERKDSFMQFVERNKTFALDIREGANLKSLDKGCLILNTNAEEGFRVLSVDNNVEDAHYWRDKFLQLTPTQDDQFLTKNYIEMVQGFCSSLGDKESMKDQIFLIKKAVNYFGAHEKFDFTEFANHVIEDKSLVSKFKTFKKDYESKTGMISVDSFTISKRAFQKAKRAFKDFIRLDTQIEVKLKFSDPNKAASYVKRGFDRQKNMHFYKLYFNREL